MSKFQRSWLLFKTSVRVIQQNKKLLIFPILSFCLTILIVLFFITPVALQKTGYGFSQWQHWEKVGQSLFVEKASSTRDAEGGSDSTELSLKPLGFACLIGVYFLSMFLATFFNVAFFNEILGALKGDPVSVREGLAFACSKWKSILMWTLFAGIIGLIIKTLEEKLELFGRIVMRLIGIAWSVASVFAIPVLVREEGTQNPVAVLKKSALTLKKTWGESLIGYLGLQFGGGLVLLLSLFYLGAAVFASVYFENFWIMAVAGLLWLLGMIALGYLSSVASQVYRCALYMYASEGVIAEPYNRELLDMAWKFKKS